ncbi:MAG: hypothetical protein HFI47_01675 [Lachnospiraceae bacterium]|nr:hypothetical protein [Lachnospiraceae bacterium]
MRRTGKRVSAIMMIAALSLGLLGCGRKAQAEEKEDVYGDNIIITETGEVLQREQSAATDVPAQPEEAKAPQETPAQPQETEAPKPTPTPEVVTPDIELTEPEQVQVITEEDQIAPMGNELQIVFLGDSIFDNNRDGTGVPYLTAVKCQADVYNLAIGGTSASAEADEQMEDENWTSRSLVGVVKAMMGKIPTDIFAGTRTKEILDNSDVDFSQTDYFVVEYGINDFFRAVPQSNPENEYDQKTYAGALRYAVSNLQGLAPDATIILCAPNYAQFFNGDRFIGDGNTLNTGNGTLFDYKGTCQYVSKERQTEFFDAYLDLGIDGYTAEEYLEDGVHLTAAGRQLYADALADMILSIEENKNN